MDKKLADKSPLGFQLKKNNIRALEHAKDSYLAYGLPDHHPTLVRLQHQLSHLKRQINDVAGAEFAAQVWFHHRMLSVWCLYFFCRLHCFD